MGILRDVAERVAERLWYRKRGSAFALALPFLGPATVVTAALSRRRVRRQAAAKVPAIPVIAIGNLAVGGTGKTQVVAELAAVALSAGRRVGIVTRGHGRAAQSGERDPKLVATDGEAEVFGDEPLLLARRLPGAVVVVTEDRVAGIALAASHGCELVLLDDGFQQAQVAPTRRIAVFGAEAPLGNGALLPLGPLRDPLQRLRASDLVWLHGEGDGAILPRVDVRSRTVALPSPELRSELRAGRSVFAFAGIARPGRFFRTLSEIGVSIVGTARYADHRRFGTAELERLAARAARLGAELLVCTEKDAVRLPSLRVALPIVALETRLEILSGKEAVAGLLNASMG